MIYDVLYKDDRFIFLDENDDLFKVKREDLFLVIEEMENKDKKVSFRFSKPALKEIGKEYMVFSLWSKIMIIAIICTMIGGFLAIWLCKMF